MFRVLMLCIGLLFLQQSAQAGALEDCNEGIDPDRTIRGCTQSIVRGAKGFDRRNLALLYSNRSRAYRFKGDYAKSIADCDEGIRLHRADTIYRNRGYTFLLMGEQDKAFADFEEAIRLGPKTAGNWRARGDWHAARGEDANALADYARALRLDPKNGSAYLGRGRFYTRKGDAERAIADFNVVLKFDKADPEALQGRGTVYESKGLIDLAKADYLAALALPSRGFEETKAHELARASLIRLEAAALALAQQQTKVKESNAAAPPAPGTVVTGPERRVALVIGNANYLNAEQLINPLNDARAVAATLRRLGFADVAERYNVTLGGMVEALKSFGDKAGDADWAVVYYAGHGIEIGGSTYLLPTDVKLLRDTHVPDEALPLERVLSKVESARKLRLVILDSCRTNPFVSKMTRTVASRSIGRGLGRVEPEGGVLVAYSAKHGTIALDGASGANSPFAEALLTHLEEPGLELQFLFRKVRDRVLSATQRAQEPFLYGSLSSESLYFKQ